MGMRRIEPRRAALGLVAAVLVSTASGLLVPMIEISPAVFSWVWGASIAGDLVFTAGTLLSVAGSVAYGRRTHPVGTFLLSFPLHWVVYLVSWTITSQSMEEVDGATLADAAGFVIQWGWPGLVLMPIASAVAAHHLQAWDRENASAPPTAPLMASAHGRSRP